MDNIINRETTMNPMFVPHPVFIMGQEFKHGGFLVNRGSVSSNFGLNPLPIRQSAFVPNKNHFLYRNPIHSN